MVSKRRVPAQRFKSGVLHVPTGIRFAVGDAELWKALTRHINGDWGDVSAEDKASNDENLHRDGRVFSVYHAPNGVTFSLITEAGSTTTSVVLAVAK